MITLNLTCINIIDKFFLDLFKNNELDSLTDYLMILLSKLGDYGLLMFIILGILIYNKLNKLAVFTLISTASNTLLVNLVIKEIIRRPRPFIEFPDVLLIIDEPNSYSFPSGHSAFAFSLALFLFFVLRKSKSKYVRVSVYLLALLSSLIAFSRIYLNVHFFSDVIASLIISFITSYFFYKCYKLK